MAEDPAAFSVVPDTPFPSAAVRSAQCVRTFVRGCAAAALLGCGGASGPSGPAGAGVVTSVQINTGAATVVVGGTVSLTATARDVNGTTVAGAVTSWSSAATSVATISAAGVATGVAAGTTTITASSAGVNAAIQLTVTSDDTPASLTLAPPGPLALVSGGVTTIVPTVRAADGHVVGTATVVFRSSDATVASVSAVVITAAKVGTATITATSGSASASVVVTVSAGAPSALAVRTQPGGSAVGAVLTTQPVIEIRDKAGNLVPTATNAVTVAIATGGGSISGTTTVSAVAGVATFTDLAVAGAAGTRVLSFSSPGLTPANSLDLVLAGSAIPSLVLDSTSIALSAPSGKSSPTVTLAVKNGGSTAVTGASLSPPTYDVGQPGGWLIVSASGTSAPFTISLQANAATLAPGSYRAAVTLSAAAAANSPVTITVTLTVVPSNTITYGSATEKIRILDVASAFTPALSMRDGIGQPTAVGAVTFASRATSVATVDAQGRVTAVGEGTTWVAVQALGTADSVFVIVPRAGGGPVIRSDLTTYLVKAGDVTFVNVVIDTRSTPIGAATVAVGYTSTSSPVFGVTFTIPTGPPVPVATTVTTGVIRVTVASATALTGQVALLRLRVVTPVAGLSGVITLTVTDIVAPDGSDLMSVTTSTRIPIIVQ